MSVKADLLEHLKKCIPGFHISLAWVNKEQIFPCITIFQVTESRENANEEPWLSTPIIQFDTWSKTSKLESDELADKLEKALKSFRHPVQFLSRQDMDSETTFRVNMQYRIMNYLGVVK